MAPTGPDDPASVATHVHDCLDGFQNVCNSMSKAELHIKRKLPPDVINDELGRFSIWSGNVGAHRRGKGSLDYKLREASHIRDRVIELLQNLRSVLQDALEIITGERVAWEDLSDSDSDASDDGSQRMEEEPTTELAQLASNLAEINTCLMRLSMAIRNPAPHDQFKESANIDITHFETFDIEHVGGKFPMAKEYLVVRLGKAISRRRQYLRYREEHRKKLEQGLKQLPMQDEAALPQSTPRTVVAPSEKIESTVASSIPTVAKVNTSTAVLEDNDYYEDALSQTSYASSTSDMVKLRPPPLPETGQDGDPFECPLCFRFTSVRSVAAWHKHVYRDLQPYVCTSEECEIPDRTYESRHEWFHHESQVHRKHWECVQGCNQCFQSSETLRTHLWHAHANLATEDRMEDLIRSCERHDVMATSAECPLCQLELPSLPLLRRHLGKHHEELSLFALPSHMKEGHEGSDDQEDDDDDNGSRSSLSIAADARSLSPFLDAVAELVSPNDEEEERLETTSQASNSRSSLPSKTSFIPGVLRCDFGDCKSEFQGRYRRGNLIRHQKNQHGLRVLKSVLSDLNIELPKLRQGDSSIIETSQEQSDDAKASRQTGDIDFGEDKGETLESWDGLIPGSMDRVKVLGLTEGAILVDINFDKAFIEFKNTESGTNWFVLPSQVQALHDAGDFFILNVASMGMIQSPTSGPVGLRLVPETMKLDRLRKFLEYYKTLLHVPVQPGGEETEPSQTGTVSKEADRHQLVTTLDQDQTESAKSGTRPALLEQEGRRYQVQGEDFVSAPRGLRVSRSTGTLEINGDTIYIHLQCQSVKRTWACSSANLSDVVFEPSGWIEIRDIERTDTGSVEDVMIKALDQAERLEFKLLLDSFLELKSTQSLPEQQHDVAQSPLVAVPGSSPLATAVAETSSTPGDDIAIVREVHYLLVDGSIKLADATVSIFMHAKDFIMRDTRYQGRQWRISKNSISDLSRLSSNRIQFTVEYVVGYTNMRPRVALACQSERDAETLITYLKNRVLDSKLISRIQRDIDQGVSYTPSRPGLADLEKDIDIDAQKIEESGHPNITLQEVAENPLVPIRGLDDLYIPYEDDELIDTVFLHAYGVITPNSVLVLQSTRLSIKILEPLQIWQMDYKDMSMFSRPGNSIHVRGLAYTMSSENTFPDGFSRREFSFVCSTSARKTDIIRRMQGKNIKTHPLLPNLDDSSSNPSSSEDKRKHGGDAGTILFSAPATVREDEAGALDGVISLTHDRLIAEDPSTSSEWSFQYKDLNRVLYSKTSISIITMLGTVHSLSLESSYTAVEIQPSLPEDIVKIMSLLKQFIPNEKIFSREDSDTEPEDAEDTLPLLAEGLQGEDSTSTREADIIRRCQQLDPPISTEALRQTDAFNAAVQTHEPMTDEAWELLLPRLRAEIPPAGKPVPEPVSEPESDMVVPPTPPLRYSLADDEKDNDQFSSEDEQRLRRRLRYGLKKVKRKGTTFFDRAESSKPDATDAMTSAELEASDPGLASLGVDIDDMRESTSLERALQRARRSGRRPGELLRRLTSGSKDEKAHNPPEEVGSVPHES